MEKNKPKENKVVSPKRSNSAPHSEYRSWLKEHKYEVISGFFVAVAVVYIAFWLTGRGERNALYRATQQRLHLVVLEAQYNGTDAKEILDNYADANSFGINLNRPKCFAAVAALQDTNILLILPLHKVSLLRSYVNSISTLNQSLQVHQEILESQNYKNVKQARQNVHENAAAVFAMCQVLQEELRGHFDESLYDQKEAKRIERRIKHIKRKPLKGEVSLSKEN